MMLRHCPIPLGPDALMALARAQTGIAIDDEAAREPLTVLHRSISEQGGLHEAGALAQQAKLLRLLKNRLRMQRDFTAHPEIAEQDIPRPLFVVGFARTGTTKTQKTLAATGDFNFLPFWKAFNPALHSGNRSESPQARIDEAEAYCTWFDAQSPLTRTGHAFETHEPEEETTLTEHCLVAPSFIGFSDAPEYLGWMATQPPTILFEFLRDTLKYLQWQGLAVPGRKWLLKAPTYYGLEEAILGVFPDADFVMTHRSPLQTVPSSCRLIDLFRMPFGTAPVDVGALVGGFTMMMDLHIANRERLAGLRVLDLAFTDVTRNMASVAERIYAHCGLEWNARSRAAIAAWEANHPQHGHGTFTYALEDYGLTESGILRDFAAYEAMRRRVAG
ncbi:MAG: sulfotransferase [Sphingomonadales bacterium]|nr:sulfotransferase [Sphingomonadales bacterium]